MGLFDKFTKKSSAVEPLSFGKINPQLASNMPLSSLLRVFLFTSGDGKTVFSCPVATGVFADTVGALPNDVFGKVPFDIIAGTDVGKQIMSSGQFPESAWISMSRIAPDVTEKAQRGEYKSTVRPFENPNTQESGVWMLLYKKMSATIRIIRDSSMVAAIVPTVISLNGVQIATLANGSSVDVHIDSGHIVLQTNSVGSKYVRYELEVPNGANGEIHVKGGVFQPKLTVWR
jgi:hypothetical protein